jgi:hypothetical protein
MASQRDVRALANADANGNFVFPFVAAGTYLVEAMGPGALEIGSLTITTPIEPFALALKPLPTARGRVTFDGEAPPEIKPQIRELYIRRGLLRFQPIGPRLKRRRCSEGQVWLRLTGRSRFRLSSAGSFAPTMSPGLGRLARVVVNGRDITDVAYDFQSGDVDGIEVVLTRRVGGITGTVADGGH